MGVDAETSTLLKRENKPLSQGVASVETYSDVRFDAPIPGFEEPLAGGGASPGH